jgi:hypothetical protein
MIHPDDDQGNLFFPPGKGKKQTRQVLTKEQLKKKAPPFPIPKELKETYKRVVVALKKGEDGILVSLKETPNHMLIVSQEDLNAPRIHEKVVKLSSLSKDKNMDFLFQKPQQDPHLQAKQTYNRNEKIATLREKINDLISNLEGLKEIETQEFQLSKVIVDTKALGKQDMNRNERAVQTSDVKMEISMQKKVNPSGVVPHENVSRQPESMNFKVLRSNRFTSRFRDWNPDVKVARRAGISIRYSSRSNEVRCPELNISSKHVSGSKGYTGPRVQLTSRGSVKSSGGGGIVYSGSSSSESSSQSSSSSSKASDSGSKSSGSSGKGEVIKK